jgi:hypothetical protein
LQRWAIDIDGEDFANKAFEMGVKLYEYNLEKKCVLKILEARSTLNKTQKKKVLMQMLRKEWLLK